MFGKLLIANRGEIAVRVIRTCKKMGIPTVAVYSEADIRSQYVQEADESVFIGPAPARESFLDVHKIISVAKNLHCDAVHPGYGFLSENADFASQVAQEGITFIGPPPSAIAVLGDKMASKLLAIKAGVPVVPGVHDTDSADVLREAAVEMGFPVLLKPAAGGGGRGMRIISRVEDFSSALSACKEETKKSFADDRIFLEKFISKPRHIEFQVMADGFGNVIHLGERECSIQRRYQKVIEETPSPILDATLREKMGDVACKLALAAGYVNAGTVEFILDQEKNFYFLEMNTRLQVEHPITELVTGLDLVEMQIRIAAGEQIKLRQEHVVSRGWAIESRICAEDPTRGFLPTTGMITRYAAPRGRNIRVDSGVGAGSIITIYYDSLLAKVAVWGETRLQAIQTMCKALNGYHIEGLTTNVDFCNAVINHPAFINGDLSTEFIENHFENGQSKLPPQRLHLCQMVIAAVLVHHTRQRLIKDSLKPMSPLTGISPARRKVHDYIIRSENDVFRVQTEQGISPNDWRITDLPVRLEVGKPVLTRIGDAVHLGAPAYDHLEQLRPAGAIDAAIVADPQPSLAVGDDSIDEVVWQPVGGGDRHDAPVAQDVQPAVRADPQCAGLRFVLDQRPDVEARKPARFVKALEAGVGEPGQSATVRADPKVLGTVFKDDADALVRKAVRDPPGIGPAIAEAVEPLSRACPHRAIAPRV